MNINNREDTRPPVGSETQSFFLPFEEYVAELKKSIDTIDKKRVDQAIDMLFEAYTAGKNIYIFGNGGSLTTAQHMAAHLNIPNGTDLDNPDYYIDQGEAHRSTAFWLTPNLFYNALEDGEKPSYTQSFVMELEGKMKPGDILIGISGSGQSPNILNAFKYGKDNGARTIGLLGFMTGGKAAELVDCPIVIGSNNYGPIEDVHASLAHIIPGGLARRIKEYNAQRRNIGGV